MNPDDRDFSRSVLQQSIQENTPLCVENAAEVPELKNHASILGKPFMSVIVVSMRMNDQIKGALYLDRRKITAEPFKRDDLTTIQHMADVLIPILIQQEELNTLQSQIETDRFGPLIDNSPPMPHLYRQIRKFAPRNISMYIQGKTGTGKELVARQLHELSPRADKPFVVINCGRLQREQVDSQLFGHVRGAFTCRLITNSTRIRTDTATVSSRSNPIL